MALSRVLRLLRTARHLRVEQVAYRLYYRLGRRLVRHRAQAAVGKVVRRSWVREWGAPLIGGRSHFDPGVFGFLGESGDLGQMGGWNSPTKTKLWLYNLHYLDDLNAYDADARGEQHAWLIDRWIDENPPLQGNGWEPYTLSLRIVNLVKWFARQPTVPERWLSSLAAQAQALVVQEERHILANHLFANGKALVFVGAFLGGAVGERCLRQGLAILDREIPEQFCADGGHFELSPMYHATLLWDLCDLVNLADRSGLALLAERSEQWRRVIDRGLDWLAAMSHPDGEISFFNDAAFDIAPAPAAVDAYAKSLGGRGTKAAANSLSAAHLADTGYVVVSLGNNGKAILDVAEVGPSYQPGHAHADTLSFELSLFGQRVLVNTGTSQYGEGKERQRQRSTCAHNTVEIDGENSSEVWAGFRVARRARPRAVQVQREASGRLVVSACHDGYERLSGRPIHRRTWMFEENRLRVVDTVSGSFSVAIGRFFLHPDIKVADGNLLCLPDGRSLRWSCSGGYGEVVRSIWHPAFGASIPNHCLEVLFEGHEVTLDFSWC
ncbi:MAG: Heparinase family protein [Proteobacteria bacterium]|nr:Heparinase family protein [Pseudomonadota bacterium]